MSDNGDSEPADDEPAAAMRTALEALPDEQREVMLLTACEGRHQEKSLPPPTRR